MVIIIKFFRLCYVLGNIYNKVLEKLNLDINSLRTQILAKHN